ncbi:MAG TPA: helix-turn-helix domain-containing protein [Fontimonas sp.]
MKKAPPRTAAEPTASARGRKPIFRSEDVLKAAQELVESQGREALSMRGIASHLGTGVATLYHYFGSLAELMDALALALLDELPEWNAENAQDTRAYLRDLVLAYSRLAARYPDFERMVGPLADQRILRLFDSALRAMLSAKVDVERAAAAWSNLQSLAISHAAATRRLDGARREWNRKRIGDLDAVQQLFDAGVLKAGGDEWFGRVLDLTLDQMLPELKAKSRRR